ncbi:MAG: hypothetical protein PHH54_01605 [Candidatus Nanoarchaeia archaeon]|nr:hypothetical protein [Candidatus Nanoarchaeia archaeon]MDD5740658.1 hypothetical protein [Candidatus Nanoarchaeia archaeon]
MSTEKLKKLEECLQIFFDKEVFENLKPQLEKFKEDSWLIEHLYSKIGEKEMRNLGIDDFKDVVLIIDKVIMPDYPVNNVLNYYRLYARAIEENYIGRFSNILAHLNRVGEIEKNVPSMGIIENKDYGKRDRNNNIDSRPYLFEDTSYIEFIREVLTEDSITRQNRISLDRRLEYFESHLQNLKDEQIKVGELFSYGYSKVIKTLDSAQNNVGVDKFQETSQKVKELIKRLDSLGLDMYTKSSVDKIDEWLSRNKFGEISLESQYLSKEALMYITGLHLKKD